MRLNSFPINALPMLFAAALLCAGCGATDMSQPDSDAHTDWVDEEAPTGSLEFDHEGDVDLSPRQRESVSGHYIDPDGIPTQTTITLSLLGNAFDASLEETTVETGEDGLFTAGIIAGSINTEFSLRAVAYDGAQSEIGIRIVSSYDGIVKIEPLYEGRRHIDYYEIHLHEHASCPATGEVPRYLLNAAPEESPVMFSHLPESMTFTVVVRGYPCEPEDEADAVCVPWVVGCRENVVTQLASPDTVNIAVLDAIDYFSREAFTTGTDFNARELLAGSVDPLLSPLDPLAAAVADIADFLLDEIQNRMDEAQQDIFYNARPDIYEAVIERLSDSGADSLAEEISELKTLLHTSIAAVTLAGRLEKDFWPEDPDDSFTAKHILESVVVGEKTLIEDLGVDDDTRESLISVSYNRDIATLGSSDDPIVLPIGGGSLLLAISGRVGLPAYVDIDADSVPFSAWLMDKIKCDEIAAVLAGHKDLEALAPPDNPTEWYKTLCSDIITEIVREIDQSAQGTDTSLPFLEFSGAADFLQEDGMPLEGKTAAGEWTLINWGSETFSDSQSFVLEPSVSLE